MTSTATAATATLRTRRPANGKVARPRPCHYGPTRSLAQLVRGRSLESGRFLTSGRLRWTVLFTPAGAAAGLS